MTYRLPAEALLRRVAYHGRLPFACPLACDVRDEAGALHRADYVDGSMLDHAGARYVVEGRLCQLGRDGVLRAVLPPWLVAFSAVLIVLLLGALLGLIVSGVEERRRAAEAARWNTRMAGLRAAEQIAQQALGAAIGPTQRLACCARPDYPDGAAYCISCGRRI